MGAVSCHAPGILSLNSQYRNLFSNDLGAAAAFLFEVGTGRYPLPERGNGGSVERWRSDIDHVRAESAASAKAVAAAREADHTHTEIQGWLRDLGVALGFQVWIASNDAKRSYKEGRLADGCLERLPAALAEAGAADAIRLIDVLWVEQSGEVSAAFEVEHTTSIYSGIVQMLDLALGIDSGAARNFFLVAPDDLETEVRSQFARPAFSRVSELNLRYLPYSELRDHRDAIARFGSGIKAIRAIAKPIGSSSSDCHFLRPGFPAVERQSGTVPNLFISLTLSEFLRSTSASSEDRVTSINRLYLLDVLDIRFQRSDRECYGARRNLKVRVNFE